jgi:hypothetical protein
VPFPSQFLEGFFFSLLLFTTASSRLNRPIVLAPKATCRTDGDLVAIGWNVLQNRAAFCGSTGFEDR